MILSYSSGVSPYLDTRRRLSFAALRSVYEAVMALTFSGFSSRHFCTSARRHTLHRVILTVNSLIFFVTLHFVQVFHWATLYYTI